MGKKRPSTIPAVRYRTMRLFIFKERKFFVILMAMFILAGIFSPYPSIAMWLGFFFAGYAAVANDSIQTIGTFLASNHRRPWWVLWLFISGIFIAVMTYSYVKYSGDVSFQRLSAKGFEKAPEKFAFLQLAAPLVLLLLTRFRMPVSTTFLCLSAYSANLDGITRMLGKSVSGYTIAFAVSFVLWFILSRLISQLGKGQAHPFWNIAQWIISGSLWATWLAQDGANIVVTLPRELTLTEFLIFIGYITIGLGVIFYLRGGKIQQIITKKSDTKDVRAATLIDLVYTLILLVFLNLSKIPMSTTWVFLGLLGGREIAIAFSRHYEVRKKGSVALKLIFSDISNAMIGLIISVLIAIIVNPGIQEEIRMRLGV
jgi:hypothetical protein